MLRGDWHSAKPVDNPKSKAIRMKSIVASGGSSAPCKGLFHSFFKSHLFSPISTKGNTPHMKRVLIADDERTLRLMIQATLKPMDVELLQACDGEEALALAQAEMPDLLLLDWMMPKMTGVEVAAVLRENAETKSIPIIMLTARGQQRDEEVAKIAGVDQYLTKPFSPRQLLALVQQTLGE